MVAFLEKRDRWNRQDESLQSSMQRDIDRSMRMLEEIRDRILNLQGRIGVLERVINERVPGKALTEKKFMEETSGSDDIVDRIVSEVKSVGNSLDKRIFEQLGSQMKLSDQAKGQITIAESSKPQIGQLADVLADKLNELRQMFDSMQQKPTIVERKRMEKIAEALQKHQQLSSEQLSQLIGLSRTRCNEYFKQMESFGVVEPVLEGKEKFYKLS